jgi:hypothetical protein
VHSFRDAKFEHSICHISYQFFFDISKLKVWLEILITMEKCMVWSVHLHNYIYIHSKPMNGFMTNLYYGIYCFQYFYVNHYKYQELCKLVTLSFPYQQKKRKRKKKKQSLILESFQRTSCGYQLIQKETFCCFINQQQMVTRESNLVRGNSTIFTFFFFCENSTSNMVTR